MRFVGTMTLVCAVAACGQIPGLDAMADDAVDDAPYPDLLPQHALPAPTLSRLTDTSEAEIEARGARLSRRAGTL